jgi:ABC-type branched-subunit amino acid transport system substrate-binding protein
MSRFTRHKRRSASAVGLALVAVLSMGLSACSSSGSKSSSSSSAAAGNSSAAPSGSASAGETASSANGGLGDLGKPSGGTDIGLTATTMRIAIIADVASPFQPGLFQDSEDAVKAWGDLVNAHGGIAGRKVTVDFIDSKSDANTTRNAIIKACSQDFAMVGTFSIVFPTAADMASCKNSAGQAIGIPDLAASATSPAEGCNADTFNINGQSVFCAGLGKTPQPYQVQVGEYRYFLSQDSGVHGLMVAATDTPTVLHSNIATWDAATKVLGFKSDGEGVYTTTSAAPQSALTPIIQAAKQHSSTLIYNEVLSTTVIALKNEAQLQGLNSVKYWVCHIGCYDNKVLASSPSTMEGVYSEMNFLPFYTEGKTNPSLNALITQLGGDTNKTNAYGVDSWIAAMVFQDAVVKAAATGTLNRQTLLDALKSTHDETAHGIVGKTDVGAKLLSPCMLLSQVKDGKWVRAYPTQPGTFNCDAANLQDSSYSA